MTRSAAILARARRAIAVDLSMSLASGMPETELAKASREMCDEYEIAVRHALSLEETMHGMTKREEAAREAATIRGYEEGGGRA